MLLATDCLSILFARGNVLLAYQDEFFPVRELLSNGLPQKPNWPLPPRFVPSK